MKYFSFVILTNFIQFGERTTNSKGGEKIGDWLPWSENDRCCDHLTVLKSLTDAWNFFTDAGCLHGKIRCCSIKPGCKGKMRFRRSRLHPLVSGVNALQHALFCTKAEARFLSTGEETAAKKIAIMLMRLCVGQHFNLHKLRSTKRMKYKMKRRRKQKNCV